MSVFDLGWPAFRDTFVLSPTKFREFRELHEAPADVSLKVAGFRVVENPDMPDHLGVMFDAQGRMTVLRFGKEESATNA